MSTHPTNTPPWPPDALRELAGLVLLLVGIAGLAVAAFMVSLELGIAALSAPCIAAGLRLTIGRT